MPLFFMLSGYLFGFSQTEVTTVRLYMQLIRKKVKRLIYPFFTVAFVFFIIKYVAGIFFKLQHPMTMNTVIQLFINPLQSYMPLLWFIYTLFIIFLIFPLFLFLFKNETLLLIITLLLMYFPWPSNFCLTNVFSNLPYFSFGYLLASKTDINKISLRRNMVIAILSALLFLSFYFSYPDITDNKYLNIFWKFILGVSGSVMCWPVHTHL